MAKNGAEMKAEIMTAERRQVLSGAKGGNGALRLTPAAPANRVSLRAAPEDVPALSRALGLQLPGRPKTSTSNGERMAFWLGPDEWLLIDEAGGDLMGNCAASGAVHAATDVSHRNIGIIVSGPGASAALNAACALDLTVKAFPVGAVTRTVFGKIEVVLYRMEEDTFRVECWRSFAEYAFGMLVEAADDLG